MRGCQGERNKLMNEKEKMSETERALNRELIRALYNSAVYQILAFVMGIGAGIAIMAILIRIFT